MAHENDIYSEYAWVDSFSKFEVQAVSKQPR